MENEPTRVVVVGQGYVGLPLAVRAVECGYDVVGLELDHDRVKQITASESFTDDISDAELAEVNATGRYRVTTDPNDCGVFQVALITVPTPLSEGIPDLSFIREAATVLAGCLRPGALVVLESTTYPGTTEEIVRPILEAGSGLRADLDFSLGFSPERIDPGRDRGPFWQTPKVISGVGAASLRAVEAFYRTIVEEVVSVSSTQVAEMTKLLENTFRHTNIALMNEIAMLASDLDVDVWEAIDAAATKPYGFMKFVPGPGVGGHCLPIDPSYLDWWVMRRLNVHLRFVNLANEINTGMPGYVVGRVFGALNAAGRAVRGARILLVGLAYKANTSDVRESASFAVAERLLRFGADVHACDPRVGEVDLDERVARVQLTREELLSADLVVILTDHDDFDYDLIADSARRVLDTRHRVHGRQVEYL
ncbi:nucleotide sugar dehydrogenase [Natronosporangium hydrolyticum]|uniref:Nucleotide sugar dehydrogenase n=1 Tax=Natronosporangium hydrolyticum TaxID=2811111 RepID=A0A895YMB4_9ACTN|nr:nucleotide sugar dehydrogenase [Natronosporangium hydrolyticum]QSB16453.1 nucleotide sugar dehydrogenase [Natronosporangium hydrolyticum]